MFTFKRPTVQYSGLSLILARIATRLGRIGIPVALRFAWGIFLFGVVATVALVWAVGKFVNPLLPWFVRDVVAVLGMIAYFDPKAQFESVSKLADYLGQRAGLDVHLKLYNDYCSLLNDIDHESLDLAIVSPLVYAYCMDDPALTYLSTTVVQGTPFYHCIILTRKDSPIHTVQDLAGKMEAGLILYSHQKLHCWE